MSTSSGHTSSPDLSVVIPTRDRARSVRRTLEALCRQTYPAGCFEVIVVANDSSDDTGDIVRTFPAPYRLRLVETPIAGMSLARNAGASLAVGEVLVFVDDDIVPVPGFLAAHARGHAGRTDLVAVGPLLAPPRERAPGLFVERLRALDAGFASLLAGVEGHLDWFCMTGGNVSMSKALFLRVGGFDAAIGTYGSEDYELGCRAQKAGASFAFLAEAGGHHYSHENSSFDAYLRKGRSVGRNDTLLVRRHPEIVDRVLLGLATRPSTPLGRVARRLAFDRPGLGDALARSLAGVCAILESLRMRRPWNRLADCLYQYWYFRGVGDVAGDAGAVGSYLESVRNVSAREGAQTRDPSE